MIVRRVGIDDYKEMMELMKEFSGHYGMGLEPNESGFYNVFRMVLFNGVGVVALKDERIIGAIGGTYHNNLFNDTVIVLTELFWYVKPEFRGTNAGGRLFLEYEKAGYAGADYMTMTLLDTSVKSLDNGLKKRGFEQKERMYIKWRGSQQLS